MYALNSKSMVVYPLFFYAEQQDIHMALTTVREALEFSAYMRLDPSITELQRTAFIDEVMQLLELTEISDRKV